MTSDLPDQTWRKQFFIFIQRNDIAMAISKFDQFDFLIDIVPRDELKPTKRQVIMFYYLIYTC